MRRKKPLSNPIPILCEKCGAILPKLTAAEVAAILQVSVKTIQNGGAGTDELPREYYGHTIRFDKREVEAFLERKRKESRERLHFAFAGHPKALARVLARLGLGEPDETDSADVMRIKQYLAERKVRRRRSAR